MSLDELKARRDAQILEEHGRYKRALEKIANLPHFQAADGSYIDIYAGIAREALSPEPEKK